MQMTIAAFLLSITSSLVKRVLFVLGIGFVTFAALTTFTDQVISAAQSSYNEIPATVLQFLNLAGVGHAFGVITAALTARAALAAVKKLRPL